MPNKKCFNIHTYIYALRRRARRLCNTFGIRPRMNEKPGAHREFSDPQLENIRAYIRAKVATKGVHPRLVANFDQVWSLQFRPARTCLQRSTNCKGLKEDPLMKSKFLRQVRHNVERALDLDLTEPNPAHQKKENQHIPQIQGQAASTSMVQNWRQPRTLTTLSFVDGHVARGYVTFKEGTISRANIDAMNQELSQHLHIAEPQPNSHIWSEKSPIPYLEFLAQEVRCRRTQLGLTARDRCLIIMDQAAAHMSRTYLAIQKRWCEENNVVTQQDFIYIYIYIFMCISIFT